MHLLATKIVYLLIYILSSCLTFSQSILFAVVDNITKMAGDWRDSETSILSAKSKMQFPTKYQQLSLRCLIWINLPPVRASPPPGVHCKFQACENTKQCWLFHCHGNHCAHGVLHSVVLLYEIWLFQPCSCQMLYAKQLAHEARFIRQNVFYNLWMYIVIQQRHQKTQWSHHSENRRELCRCINSPSENTCFKPLEAGAWVCAFMHVHMNVLGEKTDNYNCQTESKRKRGRRRERESTRCTFMIFTGLCACEDT